MLLQLKQKGTWSIIIPAHNEGRRLSDCLEKVLSFLDGEEGVKAEVIIAEDGSTDGTLEIARRYAERDGRVKIVHFPEKMGKGGGIKHGLLRSENDIVILMDADLAVEPPYIKRLTEAILRGADIALGSRRLPNSRIKNGQPIHRALLSGVYQALFEVLFPKIGVRDVQCGFKAFRREVLLDLVYDVDTDGFAFDTELVVKAWMRGYRIVEVPVEWSHVDGSKVRAWREALEMGMDLVRIWLESKRRGRTLEDEGELKRFYDSLPGDVYYRASRSLFLPRRFWHRHKNGQILEALRRYGRGVRRVLDVGCGSGVLTERLGEEGYEVYGVDIGEGFLRWCQGRRRHINSIKPSYLMGDARSLPFAEASFDAIICSEVLEHFKREAGEALEQFRRLLRPGGLLVITTPRRGKLWGLVEAVWTNLRRRELEANHSTFTRAELACLLEEHGFEVLTCGPFMFNCLLFALATPRGEGRR
ncbi:glycosyltransferase [Candidatus Bathyarchaeota archaeon]|nr:MAG: glycosyltransferase [Candidatus Bathyarchaeota archaeon]